MSAAGFLGKQGLLNTDSVDLRDMQGAKEPTTLVGFCSAFSCTGVSSNKRGLATVFGASPRKSNFCPKCKTRIVLYDEMNRRELDIAIMKFYARFPKGEI